MTIATANAGTKAGVSVAAANGTAQTFDFTSAEAVCIDCILTALTGGTSPSVQFILERLSADGATWVQLSAATALTVASSSPSTGISSFEVGPGLAINKLVGTQHRIRWVTTGTPATAVATVNAYQNGF